MPSQEESPRGDRRGDCFAKSDDRKGSDMPRKTTEAAATTKTKKSVVRASSKKTAATKKTTESPVVLTWEHVAERAYYIHLETGHEDPTENWLRAEQELATV
jgi:hypothetical protein